MRVYVPLTLSVLEETHQAGELGPEQGAFVAYAVTPGLREWYVSDDEEELEYAALGRAAQASLRLLAADPGAARRRVVLALDVPDGAVSAPPPQGQGPDTGGLGEVRVEGPVPLAKAAAVHVDAGDAGEDVAAAAQALATADAGDEDARSTVDGAEDHELLWFATQEIGSVLGREQR